jgi:hypothetical protein
MRPREYEADRDEKMRRHKEHSINARCDGHQRKQMQQEILTKAFGPRIWKRVVLCVIQMVFAPWRFRTTDGLQFAEVQETTPCHWPRFSHHVRCLNIKQMALTRRPTLKMGIGQTV